MPDKDVPWLLLERYYAKACTPEEEAALHAWIAGDPTRQLLVERLTNVFTDTPPRPDRSDIERAWTKLEMTIKPRPSRNVSIVALLVAGVLALLGVAWIVARHSSRQ